MYFGDSTSGEFINLYSEDNPILESGDLCFCCIFANDLFHRPLIARCQIIRDVFINGLNKNYYVKILEILESPKTIQQFFLGRPVTVYYASEKDSLDCTISKAKALKRITSNFDYSKNLFKVEAYFTRDTEEKIRQLRKEYISVIRRDLETMISDIDGILL